METDTEPAIRDKDALVVDLTRSVFEPGSTTEGTENVRCFLRDLIDFYVRGSSSTPASR